MSLGYLTKVILFSSIYLYVYFMFLMAKRYYGKILCYTRELRLYSDWLDQKI